MAYILSSVYNSYTFAMEELADPRLDGWFLMDSVIHIVLIIAAYFYIIRKLGPNLMADRKPYNIDNLLIAYNFGQILANGYIFVMIANVVFRKYNNIYCTEIDYSNDVDAITALKAVYLYFLMKIVDLLDTVFFVMRKKDNQITFLHMYHHSLMVLVGWIVTKFIGGGHVAFGPLLNCFVHVCMYSYYLLSVWDKNLKSSVGWKRHITELQLLQFIIGVCVTIGPVLAKECNVPKLLFFISIIQDVFFICLFGDFYLKTYVYSKHKGMIERTTLEYK